MAREIALLTNPAAGRGAGARTTAIVLRRLQEAGFTVRARVGQDGADAVSLARRAVDEGADSLVVVGGDGLVHMAAQALAGSEVNLGIVPTGTGNDVARSFGIPRSSPEAAADVVVGSRVRHIDLGRAGPSYFVTVLAAGFDALVNERANRIRWPRGQIRYNLATLAELRVFRPISYTLELDGVQRRLEAMLVAVGNGPSFGGGLRIAHGAELDDGLLDVVIIKPISTVELVRTFPRLYSGRHVTHPQYEHHRVKSVTVAAPGVVGYADGEPVGALPLTVEVAPMALRVLVPR